MDKTDFLKINMNSPFINFVDKTELMEELSKLPARRKAIEEAKKECDELMDKIVNAYVAEANARTANLPAAYCLMAGYIYVKQGMYMKCRKIPGMVPALDMQKVTLNTDKEKIFTGSYTVTRTDIKYNGIFDEDAVAIEASGCPIISQIFSLLERIHDMEDISFTGDRVIIYVPEDLETNNTEEIKQIIEKHFEKAEKNARKWFSEIDQYADPSGLFAAMI